jgi:hypothetical protein
MSTAQALSTRRRGARRGHFFRAKAERPYAPSREAMTFKPGDVTISVGEA